MIKWILIIVMILFEVTLIYTTDNKQCMVKPLYCYNNPNPCLNGGNCTDILGDYTCNCTEGWTGRNCTDYIYASTQQFLTGSLSSYASSYPSANLMVIKKSKEKLTFMGPSSGKVTNICKFSGCAISTLPDPISPSQWYAQYIANNRTTPVLASNQTAEFQFTLFHLKYNDTVYHQGRPINDPFWWRPDLQDQFPSSFTNETTGCRIDRKSFAVSVYDGVTPLPTSAGVDAEVPIDTNDFYDYTRAYIPGKMFNGALTRKLPSKYCPYVDPYPRYPIWRDYNYSVFSNFQLVFNDDGTDHSFVNYEFPVETINNMASSCGWPYYLVMIPKSPTVDDKTIIMLAQQMLPMPDDILPNEFTIVAWMRTTVVIQGITGFSIRSFDSNFFGPSVNTRIMFKLPTTTDRIQSCAIWNQYVDPDPTDGQIIPCMTSMMNDTDKYIPTPDIHDRGPVDVSNSLSSFNPNDIIGQFGQAFNDYVQVYPWPIFPDYNPCDMNRPFDITRSSPTYGTGTYYPTDPLSEDPPLEIKLFNCQPSGRIYGNGILNEFDGSRTVGWCIQPEEVGSKKWALTDRDGNPIQEQHSFPG
jgi:hypothetical protein